MTEQGLPADLRQLPPTKARSQLRSLAQQEGKGAVELLRRALQDPALAETAIELLGEIPSQPSWDLLRQLAEGGESPFLRKAARRAQHRLRSRGFVPDTSTHKSRAEDRRIEHARASFFDPTGAQLLRLLQTVPLGMQRLAEFLVTPGGLVQCFCWTANQSDVQRFLEEEEIPRQELIEVGWGYVARRVRQAVRRSHELGQTLPEDYFEAARLLEDAPDDPWPEELDAVTLAGRPAGASEAARLVLHPTMWRWLLPPTQMIPYAKAWLRQVQVQSLHTEEGVTNLAALRARGQLITEVLDELLDQETRRRFGEQLREHARLLHATGEKDLAAAALHCAVGLEQDDSSDNPFLRALVEHSLAVALDEVEEEEKEEEERQRPWTQRAGPTGPLWIPRATPEGEQEEKPSPRLWLPGQE